jgi:hypothetical protein
MCLGDFLAYQLPAKLSVFLAREMLGRVNFNLHKVVPSLPILTSHTYNNTCRGKKLQFAWEQWQMEEAG